MRKKSIFDIIGMARRVSEHKDHSVSVEYCGAADTWTAYIHARKPGQGIIYHSYIIDDQASVGDNYRTIEQTYNDLKEYLP
jgi:hypothetical protein